MVSLYNILLAASPVLAIYSSSAEATGDRVISLGPDGFNGTSNVEFISTSLGQADFFKVDPAPNDTTFDSYVDCFTSYGQSNVCVANHCRWYFDAMNPSTQEVITFNFEVGYGTLYRMTLRGSWANGSIYEYEIEATHVNITEGLDKSVKVDFFGGGNEFGWSSSSQLLPRPSFNATVNAPELGISGTMSFTGSVCVPGRWQDVTKTTILTKDHYSLLRLIIRAATTRLELTSKTSTELHGRTHYPTLT